MIKNSICSVLRKLVSVFIVVAVITVVSIIIIVVIVSAVGVIVAAAHRGEDKS